MRLCAEGAEGRTATAKLITGARAGQTARCTVNPKVEATFFGPPWEPGGNTRVENVEES